MGLASCLVMRIPRSAESETIIKNDPQTFTFEGTNLVAANAAARAALSPEDLEDCPLTALTRRLSDIFPQFDTAFDTACLEHARFDMSELTTDGPVAVQVDCTGQHSNITIKGLPDLMAGRVLLDRGIAEANTQELAILRSTVETSPTIVWREDRLGTINWVNAAYLSLAEQANAEDQIAWPPMRLFEGATITAPGDTPQPRRAPLMLPDGTTRWFDITSFGHGNTTLHYACDASKTVKAEEALRAFMQTLTQTFSSLPIGLAIFDRNRQLQLFNPALVDLTTLEPEWLAARPTLYDTINRLREKRMLPERKDFTDWRAKISELDKSAVDGSYLETWTLPTGQTYKVTGRPHPHGAVAFLIEDITAEVSLTRKFRRELELSQSLLDGMSEAVAVFDATGVLVVTNAAYCDLWGTDPELALAQTGIMDATRHWQAQTSPTPLWGEVRDFVCHVSVGERAEWSGQTTLGDGRPLECTFIPLAGGATKVSFATSEETLAAVAPTRELETLSG